MCEHRHCLEGDRYDTPAASETPLPVTRSDSPVQERRFGYFQRVIELPKDANSEQVHAEMKNGLLAVIVNRITSDTGDMEAIREVS